MTKQELKESPVHFESLDLKHLWGELVDVDHQREGQSQEVQELVVPSRELVEFDWLDKMESAKCYEVFKADLLQDRSKKHVTHFEAISSVKKSLFIAVLIRWSQLSTVATLSRKSILKHLHALEKQQCKVELKEQSINLVTDEELDEMIQVFFKANLVLATESHEYLSVMPPFVNLVHSNIGWVEFAHPRKVKPGASRKHSK